MNSIEVKNIYINNLFDLFADKLFAVPKLQREFVWNTNKACALLDSIYHNYPIGTVSIWKTESKNQNALRHEYHALPGYDSRNRFIWFIIDGQQRLSVIYHIMKGDKIENASGKEIDFGNIYFSLDRKDKIRFVSPKRPNPNMHIKVADIVSDKCNYIFKKEPRYKLNQIKKCRMAILYYKLFAIVIRTNEVEEVEETFLRINSLGTPLSSADKIFARAKQINLRHLINGVRSHLKHGFDRIPNEAMILPITLIEGSKRIGAEGGQETLKKIQADEEKIKKFNLNWKDLSPAYGLAVDYLHKNFNVINYDFLPSQNMVSLMAIFFYYNNNAQPNSYQKKQIKKWYWYTAIKSRYSGRGYLKNILADNEYFKKLGQRKRKPFDVAEKISVNTIKYADYSKKSSLVDAYYCLLSEYEPQYLNGGGCLPLDVYSTRSNQKNKHHIFPRAHLRKKGFDYQAYNSIANICFLVLKDNLDVGSQPPKEYLKGYKHRRYFSRVMRSHLIPYKSDSGLWDADTKRGYKKFIQNRTKFICAAFERLADAKLFNID